MTKRDLETAMDEAERFLSAANRLKQEFHIKHIEGGEVSKKESAACKRASLDLTRALSALRRPI